ncbi:lipocalin-like domain-containing protein [Lentzea sp. NPDC051213]|uniref:lipocalin-like domain-containing protein n=1 Tax=Lentzea sp. NPDC051213 TaxID=3364126 RepID=UPI00378A29EA
MEWWYFHAHLATGQGDEFGVALVFLRFWDLATRLRDRGRSVLVISHLAFDIERFDELHRLAAGVLCEGSAVAGGR